LTPNRKRATNRVRPDAQAEPIMIPSNARRMPLMRTVFRTALGSAPKASRMPVFLGSLLNRIHH
jgi:hypothetical protein